MKRNGDGCPGRTEKVGHRGRELLGDNMILRADANGSYDSTKGIEVGRMLESLHYDFFEEPCPFEELSETQAVAKALTIPIAFGEQNYSLWQFQWMLQNKVMKIVQPDINYNVGLIRSKSLAPKTERLGKNILPHNNQNRASSVNILPFASRTKSNTPY